MSIAKLIDDCMYVVTFSYCQLLLARICLKVKIMFEGHVLHPRTLGSYLSKENIVCIFLDKRLCSLTSLKSLGQSVAFSSLN